MKFHIKEHKDFESVLAKNGFTKNDYSFSKKRGFLSINVKTKPEAFIYYRKKESRLDEKGQFTDVITYYLNKDKSISFETWEEVLEAFDRFLKE